MGPDSLLRQKVKQKRFREGYEDGLSSTHKATSALAFVTSDTPVEMLGQFSRCTVFMPLLLHAWLHCRKQWARCAAWQDFTLDSPSISHAW